MDTQKTGKEGRTEKVKKKAAKIIACALIFLCGLGVLLYPVFSDLWNQFRQNQLISGYREAVSNLEPEDYTKWREAAEAYNESLDPSFRDAFTGDEIDADDPYWDLLNVNGDEIMGYIEIPKISVSLPIYHGTGEDVLQDGIGHLYGTSLPVGGKGTHCVLSGHRGLPSALLFTELDRLEKGDRFYLYVLGETLAYEVDQILVVDPDEVSSLTPDKDGDYVTLLTCTPYGVNTQRLLVRGHRVEEAEEEIPKVNTLQLIVNSFGWKGKLVAALAALGVVALIVAGMRRRANGKKRKAENEEKTQG